MFDMAACPYWRKATRNRAGKVVLYCEGGRPIFPDDTARRAYLGRYCNRTDGWRTCPIAQMMEEYYGRKA